MSGSSELPKKFDLFALGIAATAPRGMRVRDAVVLEPLTEDTLQIFTGQLQTKLKDISTKRSDMNFPVTTVVTAEQPLTEIMALPPRTAPIAAYLEQQTPPLSDSVLVIHADVAANCSFVDTFRFGLMVVEDNVEPNLVRVCEEQNVKVLFAFSQEDELRFTRELNMHAPGIRPMPAYDHFRVSSDGEVT